MGSDDQILFINDLFQCMEKGFLLWNNPVHCVNRCCYDMCCMVIVHADGKGYRYTVQKGSEGKN